MADMEKAPPAPSSCAEGGDGRRSASAHQSYHFYRIAFRQRVFSMSPLGNKIRIHLDGNMLACYAKLLKQHGNRSPGGQVVHSAIKTNLHDTVSLIERKGGQRDAPAVHGRIAANRGQSRAGTW